MQDRFIVDHLNNETLRWLLKLKAERESVLSEKATQLIRQVLQERAETVQETQMIEWSVV